jgi:4-amino-4-deoxy-L-arabinose transferase-like glycosyltransferase
MTRATALWMVLAVGLAVRLANLWTFSSLPVSAYQRTWAESDMETAWRWSGAILAGDVLGRETVHPYTGWMRSMAPLATWERWWGGRGVFHQAPLYAYALAFMRLVGGDGFWGVALGQMCLGLASVAAVFLLAERVFGLRAAIMSGLGAALYGPFLLHETLLLRDELAVACSLLLLWTLLRAPDHGAGAWLGAGLSFAVALLARETLALYGMFVVVWIARRYWRRSQLRRALLSFAAGALLGVIPLVARNLLVGVAPLALSTRALESFVHGHAAGASPVGLTLPPATRAILERSDGNLGTAVRLTFATWKGNASGLVAHEWAKLRAIVSRYEAMDNVDWYYFADRSRVLAWSLRFEVALVFGLVGLFAPRPGVDDRPLRYFLVASVPALLYGIMVGRYRLAPAAVLLVYAGGAVTWLAGCVAARRWRPASIALAAMCASLVFSATTLADIEKRHRYRDTEFMLAAVTYYERGQVARAYDELAAGFAAAYRGADQTTLPPGWPRLLDPLVAAGHELGRDANTVALLTGLTRDYPDDPEPHARLALLYGTAFGRPADAAAHLAAEQRLRAGQRATP